MALGMDVGGVNFLVDLVEHRHELWEKKKKSEAAAAAVVAADKLRYFPSRYPAHGENFQLSKAKIEFDCLGMNERQRITE